MSSHQDSPDRRESALKIIEKSLNCYIYELEKQGAASYARDVAADCTNALGVIKEDFKGLLIANSALAALEASTPE